MESGPSVTARLLGSAMDFVVRAVVNFGLRKNFDVSKIFSPEGNLQPILRETPSLQTVNSLKPNFSLDFDSFVFKKLS